MLFFELFPAFMVLVCIVAGVWLFVQNLDADSDPDEPVDRSGTQSTERSRQDKVVAIGFIAALLTAPAAFAQHHTPAVARAAELSGSPDTIARSATPPVVQIFTTSNRADNGLWPRIAALATTERASGSASSSMPTATP